MSNLLGCITGGTENVQAGCSDAYWLTPSHRRNNPARCMEYTGVGWKNTLVGGQCLQRAAASADAENKPWAVYWLRLNTVDTALGTLAQTLAWLEQTLHTLALTLAPVETTLTAGGSILAPVASVGAVVASVGRVAGTGGVGQDAPACAVETTLKQTLHTLGTAGCAADAQVSAVEETLNTREATLHASALRVGSAGRVGATVTRGWECMDTGGTHVGAPGVLL